MSSRLMCVRRRTSASAATSAIEFSRVLPLKGRSGRLRAYRAPGLAAVRKPPLADALEVPLACGAAHTQRARRSSQRYVLAVLEDEPDRPLSELFVSEYRLHLVPGDAPPAKATRVDSLWGQINAPCQHPQRLRNDQASPRQQHELSQP
jgi:hypothetical protein